MKKVLFVCYGLGIGGIEKCLVNLINIMPEFKYDIDVLLMNPEYNLKKQIKRKVTFIDSFDYVMNTTDTLKEINERGGIFKNLLTFIKYILFRIAVKLKFNSWKLFKPLQKKYDYAIAYSHHDYSPYYVANKVKADKKIIWYHNGVYKKNGKEYQKDKIVFDKFDHFIAVSTDCKKIIDNRFKFLHCRVDVLKNICNVEDIISRKDEGKPSSYLDISKFHITTVGRLTKEKGADIAVKTCQHLVNNGYNVLWHWVGDGNEKLSIEEMISKSSLTNNFVLEGNQENPYKFINASDIYVQPSYYEAYSTTITEAKVLKKPIITTDVGGMRDQLIDGYNAFIVPVDYLKISKAISNLLDNRELMEKMILNLEQEKIDSYTYFEEYENLILN